MQGEGSQDGELVGATGADPLKKDLLAFVSVGGMRWGEAELLLQPWLRLTLTPTLTLTLTLKQSRCSSHGAAEPCWLQCSGAQRATSAVGG